MWIRPANSRWWSLWTWQAPFLVNEKNKKVMDISGGVDTENRNIVVWNKHGKINQQWDLIYADEYP
jgi:hypothetical protein